MLRHFVLFKNFKKNFSLLDCTFLVVGLKFKFQKLYLPMKKRYIFLRNKTKDTETFHEIFTQNIYNLKLPIDPKTIVDAGSNVGLASLFFKLKYPNASIVAIEIEKQNVEMIKKNTAGLSGISIENKALFNTKAFFKIEDPFNATNSFVIKEVGQNDPFDIESITLDEIMVKNNWEFIDILKIDIEGAELQLFSSNFEKWLPKTKIIMVETHDRMLPKCSFTVMQAINNYNFILYTTTEGTLIYYNESLIN